MAQVDVREAYAGGEECSWVEGEVSLTSLLGETREDAESVAADKLGAGNEEAVQRYADLLSKCRPEAPCDLETIHDEVPGTTARMVVKDGCVYTYYAHQMFPPRPPSSSSFHPLARPSCLFQPLPPQLNTLQFQPIFNRKSTGGLSLRPLTTLTKPRQVAFRWTSWAQKS